MQLQEGDAAPPFQLDDILGRPAVVPSGRSRNHLLSFFRNAGCAICNLRLAQLIERAPLYERLGLEVVAVFESSPDRVREQFQARAVPFPILANPQAELYDRYGVESSAEKVTLTMERPDTEAVIQSAAEAGFLLTPEEGSNFQRIPADFLIRTDGVIQIAYYGEFVFDHLPLDVIEETVGAPAAV